MNNRLDTLQSLAKIAGSGYQAYQGSKLSVLGAELQASSFRTAGANTIAAANYNNAISTINFNNQLNSFNKEVRSYVGKQHINQAASGFSASSKSHLDITSETLNSLENHLLDMRNSQKQQQEITLYNAKVAQTQYESQAQAAELAGSIRSRNAINTGLSQLTSLSNVLGRL